MPLQLLNPLVQNELLKKVEQRSSAKDISVVKTLLNTLNKLHELTCDLWSTAIEKGNNSEA